VHTVKSRYCATEISKHMLVGIQDQNARSAEVAIIRNIDIVLDKKNKRVVCYDTQANLNIAVNEPLVEFLTSRSS
jgi:hypothetical protein